MPLPEQKTRDLDLPVFTKMMARPGHNDFLSAVADRFGLWGPPGSAGVAWGNFQNFLDYAAFLNPYLPERLISPPGWFVTVAESALGLTLIAGYRLRITALLSGFLLRAFALGMTFSSGIKAPLDYSVFSASAGAFLLALWSGRKVGRTSCIRVNILIKSPTKIAGLFEYESNQ